jgi:drug/metabolite transporter (DMT)-like permease
LRAIFLGIVASFFFAVTFVLNQTMSLSGGSWMWSASLRYLFMLPCLLVVVLARGTLKTVFLELRARPWSWMAWSLIGFGAFYIPLCMAADDAPAWLIAASWQFTIIAGSLLVPLFYEEVVTDSGLKRVRKQLPLRGLLMSGIIFVGILIMEFEQIGSMPGQRAWIGAILVLIAAFAYPLGNRKMMEVCNGRMNAIERVFGMTLASLPLWLLVSVCGVAKVGWPSVGQIEQSAIVAVCSGVVATIVFFAATDMTNGDVRKLAMVEATQSGEVVFTLLLSFLMIQRQWPAIPSFIGMGLIVLGMVLHSLFADAHPNRNRRSRWGRGISDGGNLQEGVYKD